MNAEIIIVSLVVAGALCYLMRRWKAKRSKSGCGGKACGCSAKTSPR